MSIVVLALLLVLPFSYAQHSLPETWAQANASFTLKPQVEFEILNRADAFGGAVTYWWLTGGPDNMGASNIRFYLDGVKVVDCHYYECFGIGFADQTAPFSNVAFGKGGTIGALWSTIRTPYQKQLRITIQMPSNITQSSIVWFVARGVKHGAAMRYPVSVAGFELPRRAALHVTVNQNVQLNALDELTLMQSGAGVGGLVYMVGLVISSGNENVLEGCVRKYAGPNFGSFANGSEFELLGSGTEDYFSSSFYFYNAIDGITGQPVYHASESGLTHNGGSAAAKTEISMYKIHDRDLFLFDERGIKFTWRVGDTMDAGGNKCIGSSSVAGFPTNSTVTSVTWWYSF